MIEVNFLEQQNTIVNYIKEYYKTYIKDEYNLKEPNEYTTDFLDFDKHKLDFTMFFDFCNYTFNCKTNESEIQEIEFTIYLVHRNKSIEVLRNNLLNSITTFYDMFDAMDDEKLCYFDGVIDYGKISNINIYEWTEATKYLKVAEIETILRKEI